VKQPHGSPDTFLLFVYGTLKRGGRQHALLAQQVYRGEARTRPLYALLDLGAYPGLVAAAARGQVVQGELYEVNCALRDRLDHFEEAPELFDLGRVKLESVAGPVWTYFYQGGSSGKPVIESGLWQTGEERP
jgi:gamma-glutamylaminecyclotransferase